MGTKQENRLMRILTPLEDDYLLINRLSATEGLSRLFSIDAELLHEEDSEGYEPTVVDPASLIGQGISIEVQQPDGSSRFFNGICNQFSQGTRHVRFSFYNISIVPHVWVLTQSSQSRIFQQKTVPEILTAVFKGFEVKQELQHNYQKRNYCVQYRESDFDFAARLMEEEGIYFFFEHGPATHRMIIADTPQSHRDCPSKSTIPYFHKVDPEDLVTSIQAFRREYRLQPGKVTFWDKNFQKPGSPLDAEQPSRYSIGGNSNIEVYEYPGGYARKYDGIDRTGSPSEGELEHIFTDKTHTAEVAMQALDVRHQIGYAVSDCPAITAGHRYTMTEHPNTELNRQYVVLAAQHIAYQSPPYVSDTAPEIEYRATFQAIDHGAGATPFRPGRSIAKPIIQGSQTAIVVGPAGEEIFTDKYGRVKVQFNWDRDGQSDADSACWLRVAQPWAGNKWGSMFIPRIGMEVLVHFLEGDPDQPIITGCVYNPAAMPPYTLPDEKTKSTLKSYSTPGGGGFNELRFEDKKGEEQIFIHGQKDMDVRIKNDRRELIGNDDHLIVKRDKRELVERDIHRIVKRDVVEKVERDKHELVQGKTTLETKNNVSQIVGGSVAEDITGSSSHVAGNNVYIKAGVNLVLEGGASLTLKANGNFINIGPSGVAIKGTMVLINSGGAAGSGTAGTSASPIEPEEAEIADNADPGSNSPTYKNQRRKMPNYKKPTFKQPTHNPNDPKNKNKKSWIKIELKDEEGEPVAGERFRVTLPDGQTLAEGTTDTNGKAKVSNIDPGNCKITFPFLDGRAWKNG